MQVPRNTLKAAMEAGEAQYGVWLNTASAVVAEMVGHTGFDWCLIDGEHGPSGIGEIRAQVQALAGTPSATVVRVPEPAVWMVKQVLDLGVQTVVVPMVDTPEVAARMGLAMRYPPDGIRGMGAGLARASCYGQMTNYVSQANAEMCLLVQAESATALKNIDGIASAEGVDGVFIGPADLSADLGYPGNADHPDVLSAIDHMIDRIRAAGKIAGILAATPERGRTYADRGVALVGVGTDITLYRRALQATSDAARG